MVKAKWAGDKLVVEDVGVEEAARLAEWVGESIESVGIAIFEGIAYSSDEKTARDKLEF